jgi:hypothetical protein
MRVVYGIESLLTLGCSSAIYGGIKATPWTKTGRALLMMKQYFWLTCVWFWIPIDLHYC